MALDPFVVGVARLRTQPGATKACHIEGVFDPTGALGATESGESEVPEGGEVIFDGTIESIPKGIVASGTVTAPWKGVCRRCAEDVAGEVDVAVRERFVERAGPGDDAYLLVGDLVDLGPMIRDAVVLELPLAPLCREGCQGLCTQCGADLNEGPCGCEAPGDPRWATLDVLRRPE